MSILEGLLYNQHKPQLNIPTMLDLKLLTKILSYGLLRICYTQCTIYTYLVCLIHCYNAYFPMVPLVLKLFPSGNWSLYKEGELQQR